MSSASPHLFTGKFLCFVAREIFFEFHFAVWVRSEGVARIGEVEVEAAAATLGQRRPTH